MDLREQLLPNEKLLKEYTNLFVENKKGNAYLTNRRIFLSTKNTFDITAEIKGNDSVKPTPAPVRIAPINIKSRNSLKIPDCFFNNIPEKVRGVLGLLIRASEKAIVGRQ